MQVFTILLFAALLPASTGFIIYSKIKRMNTTNVVTNEAAITVPIFNIPNFTDLHSVPRSPLRDLSRVKYHYVTTDEILYSRR